jgi:hypothetical protein
MFANEKQFRPANALSPYEIVGTPTPQRKPREPLN